MIFILNLLKGKITMNKKISIILPVYNCKDTIKETIESVLMQSFKNFELIIVNDGSTDETLEICKQYKENTNIKLFDIKNSGPSHARNFAIDKSLGEYIMFIDSDDLYYNNTVEEMYNYIENNKLDIVTCNYSCLNKGKLVQLRHIINKEYKKNNIYECVEYLSSNRLFNVIWNKIYRTSILRKFNIRFNEQIELGEDYCFNVDYFESIKKAAIIDKALYQYRIMPNSICTKNREDLFYLKYNNIKYHECMYLKNGFPIDSLGDKYLDCFKSSVLWLVNNTKKSLCQKIEEMRKYTKKINTELSKFNSVKLNGENRFIFKLMKNNFNFFIYVYIKIRVFIKLIICAIKHEQFR